MFRATARGSEMRCFGRLHGARKCGVSGGCTGLGNAVFRAAARTSKKSRSDDGMEPKKWRPGQRLGNRKSGLSRLSIVLVHGKRRKGTGKKTAKDSLLIVIVQPPWFMNTNGHNPFFYNSVYILLMLLNHIWSGNIHKMDF